MAVSAQIRVRVDQRIQTGVEHRRPISWVLAKAVAEYLPLDRARRTEFRVVRAFAGRAIDVPALAEVDLATAQALRSDIAQAIHNGKECGEVLPRLDPGPAAVRIAAMIEGLATQVYRDPHDVNGVPTAELAASVITTELATVFTGYCRQYDGKGDD
jgi:hypothetical protein